MDSEKVLIGVLSGLIGGAVALFSNYWRTRYSIREQDFSKKIEETIKKIEALEDISCKYWSEDNGAQENRIFESKIIGKQTQLSHLIDHLANRYKIAPLKDIKYKMANMRNSCSGGDFASKERKASPDRIRDILIHSEQLKVELYESRYKKY